MHIYIYIYIYTCMYIYIYIYICTHPRTIPARSPGSHKSPCFDCYSYYCDCYYYYYELVCYLYYYYRARWLQGLSFCMYIYIHISPAGYMGSPGAGGVRARHAGGRGQRPSAKGPLILLEMPSQKSFAASQVYN